MVQLSGTARQKSAILKKIRLFWPRNVGQKVVAKGHNPQKAHLHQCTILDQISSVAEGLSLVKIRESFRTWKSPVGHAHSTNFFICYGLTLFKAA